MKVEENQNGAAPKILEQLVQQAERAGASDIHFQMRGQTAEVNFRLDGIIAPGTELPAEVADRVFGRIKFLARLRRIRSRCRRTAALGTPILAARTISGWPLIRP